MNRGEILANRIELLASRSRGQEAADLGVILSEHAQRNVIQSSMTVQRRHDRRMENVNALLAERVRLERDHPLAPEDRDTWHGHLRANIDYIIDHEAARVYEELEKDSQRFQGQSSERWVDDAVMRFRKLREDYHREADIMKGEREHAAKILPLPPTITLNISQSQIAGLNVGGIVGNIEANLTSIQTGGEATIAAAIKALAEAIAAEPSLPDPVKRESLEVVSAMGDELAKPAGERRQGVLRAMGAGMTGLIKHVDKVYAAYEVLKAAAKASGYDLP